MESSKIGESPNGQESSERERYSQEWVERQRGLFQEALLEGEERLQALMEDTMAAAYLKDLRGRYLTVNRWAEIMFRLTREEVLGKTDHMLFPKRIADALRANDLEALKAEAPSRCEQIFLHEDGEYVYEETRFLLFDCAGEPYAICGVARDVTGLKRAEAKLREAEERYRGIFENAVEGIYQTTPDGRFIRVNSAMARLFGYASPEEAIAELTGVDQLYVEPNRHGEFVDLMRENDRVSEFESRVYRQDGSIAWISESARVVRDADGTLLYYESFVEDVTERKKAEEALEESEDRFRSLVHNASEVVTILDPEGNISYESPSIERILGYHPEELVGEEVWDYVHPDDREAPFGALARTAQTPGEMLDPVEFRFRHKDGTWRYLEAIGNNLMDRPSVGGIVANSRDVTERKVAEEERRKSEGALKESEERYRLLAETASDTIVTVDEENKIRFVNPAAEKMFGYARDEMLDQELTMLMPERLRDAHCTAFERYLDTGTGAWNGTLCSFPACARVAGR